MPNVNQKDILNVVTGDVIQQAGGSGDWIGQASKLIDSANDFVRSLEQLAAKTNLPLIGDDAAIRRAIPTQNAPKPAPAAKAPAAAPLVPQPPAPQAPAAQAPPDLAKILTDAENWLRKKGLSDVTLGEVLALAQHRKLIDILNEVKKHGTKSER